MIVGEMRETVRLACRTDDYAAADIDRAFRDAALYMMNRRVDITRATATKTLTPHSNEVDFSTVTDFRSNRLIIAEIGFNDRGEWSTSLGSIAPNDLVQGDGDPDSYLYVATTAHTAADDKEPPNTRYWRRVENKLGTPLWKRDYRQVVYPQPGRSLHFQSRRGLQWDRGSLTPAPAYALRPDRPVQIGFRDHTTAYVRPTPRIAYPLNFVYRAPVTTWTPGDTGAANTEINIADEYMYALVNFGVPAFLEYPDPSDRFTAQRWQQFEQEIAMIRANDEVARPILYRRPNFNGA